MTNNSIAGILDKIADLLEIKGADSFRIRAYRKAAAEIDGLTESLTEIQNRGELEEIPGIGKAIAEKIEDILETGTTPMYEELKGEFPETLTDILALPNIGPKTVNKLYHMLGITTIDELEAAAREQKLRNGIRIGAKAEAGIVTAIESMRRRDDRQSLGIILPVAEEILEKLKRSHGIEQAEMAGSLRRRKDMIGDMDFVAEAYDAKAAIDAFTRLPNVEEVLETGESMCSVMNNLGMRMDLRISRKENFGAMLHHFTGSQMHNIKMRGMAKEKGLSISEYGATDVKSGKLVITGKTEDEIFEINGLPWLPPELREDRGEIEAGLKGMLPNLVDLPDIKCDLHVHSKASDGANSIPEIAEAAKAIGYQHIAICDHSSLLTIANGLSEDSLIRQIEEIHQLNAKDPSFKILTGIEADIKADGTLDIFPELLSSLDIVIGSIHHRYKNSADEMTARMVKAIESGAMDILGHPTGRIINSRDAYEFDIAKVFDAAKAHSVAMEINASPNRLDLNDLHIRMAKECGLKFCINTDAHSFTEFPTIRFGIYMARRGWLEASDVLNTYPADELISWVKSRRIVKQHI